MLILHKHTDPLKGISSHPSCRNEDSQSKTEDQDRSASVDAGSSAQDCGGPASGNVSEQTLVQGLN